MGDTPIYTFSHHNGEHTTVPLENGEHVSLRAAGVIVHRVDEYGKRTGRTVFPYASMKSYHIEYPDTCPEHGSLTACKAEGKHQDDIRLLGAEEAKLVDRINDELRRAIEKFNKDKYGAPMPIPANGVLRTPAEWSQIEGVTVVDPDGWRHSFRTAQLNYTAQDWDEPVSHDEWQDRMSVSSCINKPKKESNAEADTGSVADQPDDTEHLLRTIGGKYEPFTHHGDLVAPRVPDDPWRGGPEVGGLGDVPERAADDVERPDGGAALGPE